MKKGPFNKIHPAVIAVWASIVALGHILPTIPILGTGGTFSLSSALAPLSGIFFGPAAGALCSAVGGFIGSLIAPHTAWMGLGTFIIGTTTAFTSGCIAWGRGAPVSVNANGGFVINGAIIIYIIGTLLWFTQETGRGIFYFPLIYYGLGFIALVTGSIFSERMFTSKKKVFLFTAVWISAFGGMIGGASIGNFFSLVLYRQPVEIWAVLTIVAPIERVIFAAGAMLIGVPLLSGMNKMGIPAGPWQDEDNED
ncbi:MAG: hypothetical protein LBB81_03430 [Treponema sp.]|jgi:uncharacterized membrane protein|nr:hypothetical protein [Treponema sp.]